MLTKTKARIIRAGIAAAVALAVFPAAASAKCDTVATSKVFAPLGDTNDYFLAPGGDFEGQLQWTTSGSVVQRWTHPALPVAGSTGLVMGAGGSATSPKICADELRPTLRFGAWAQKGLGSLKVEAIEDDGTVVLLGRLFGAGFGQGGATPHVSFGKLLGVTFDDAKYVRLRLTVEAGLWVADAVYVDPYMR
jgi:hypothetical protein